VNPVLIDGYTQPGGAAQHACGWNNNAVLLIELNGSFIGYGPGLTLAGGGSRVQGLIINRCGLTGILVESSSSDDIVGNFIGTDSSGNVFPGRIFMESSK